MHPHDSGVLVGGVDAAAAGGYDAVVSLCRMGSGDLGVEQVEMWLIDGGPDMNPNLDFVLDDAARTVKALERAIAEALDAFTPQECSNFFANSGYEPE